MANKTILAFLVGTKSAQSSRGEYKIAEFKQNKDAQSEFFNVWTPELITDIQVGSYCEITSEPSSNARFRPTLTSVSVKAAPRAAATQNTAQAPKQPAQSAPAQPTRQTATPAAQKPTQPANPPAQQAQKPSAPTKPVKQVAYNLQVNPGKIKFPPITKDQVEVRLAETKENNVTLLIYKDARCDMQVLDAIFGTTGWQREYVTRGDKNFCRVSIWDAEKKTWIFKEDVGSPSNIEAEKGEASDSFKRASINVGYGRELYTCPEIKVWNNNNVLNIKEFTGNDGKKRYRCYDEFKVTDLKVTENEFGYEIAEISIAKIGTNGLVPVYHWIKP